MGSQVKKTKITAEFSYEDFLQLYGDTTLLMGVLADNKQLTLATAETDLQPKPGQTVIALVDPRDEEVS